MGGCVHAKERPRPPHRAARAKAVGERRQIWPPTTQHGREPETPCSVPDSRPGRVHLSRVDARKCCPFHRGPSAQGP